MAAPSRKRVPVLLLKTKSVPTDAYEQLFSTADNGRFTPVFVPVLEHQFKQSALAEVSQCITSRGCVARSKGGLASYGALIFTSQRAVEAFAEIVDQIRKDGALAIEDLLPEELPLYAVGPATARGLRALGLQCPILGEESGNGEALAAFMLDHYNTLYPDASKPAMLFLVGEKRRDIIPKTLQAEELGPRRTTVDEVVIYETGEMHSFKSNFSDIWQANAAGGAGVQWIVVFSPTGCKAMLQSLGLLDDSTSRFKATSTKRWLFVATIGPTTRDYLVSEFGFVPDVCAEKPSPEGVMDGIRAFHEKQR